MWFPGKDDFKSFVLSFMKETLRRNSDPKKAARADLIEFSLSCEAIRKLQKEFVPEKLQKADKQNRERHLARIKIVKQLINAETESTTSARSTSSNPTPNTDTNTPEPFFLDDIHEEEIDEISDREQAYQKRKRFVCRKSTNNCFFRVQGTGSKDRSKY